MLYHYCKVFIKQKRNMILILFVMETLTQHQEEVFMNSWEMDFMIVWRAKEMQLVAKSIVIIVQDMKSSYKHYLEEFYIQMLSLKCMIKCISLIIGIVRSIILI